MAKLSLRHVSKRYPNGFWAVKDFNLEMEDGEFVILTGSPILLLAAFLRNAENPPFFV